MSKQVMLAKIALQDDLNFVVKKNISKYIDKEFKGDTTSLKKSSKLIRTLTEIREKENKS